MCSLILGCQLLTAAPTAAQVVLTTPVALSPASPAVGQSTTATFTVQNSSSNEVEIPFLVVSVRTAANAASDFPVSHAITLQPGQSFTYSGARSFSTAGTYIAWPAYSNGSVRVALSDTRIEFSVRPPTAQARDTDSDRPPALLPIVTRQRAP
jgi:hypothetical protein